MADEFTKLIRDMKRLLFRIDKTEMKYNELKKDFLEQRYLEEKPGQSIQKYMKIEGKKPFVQMFLIIQTVKAMFSLNKPIQDKVDNFYAKIKASRVLKDGILIESVREMSALLELVVDTYLNNPNILKNVFPKEDKRDYIPSKDHIFKSINALAIKRHTIRQIF